MSDALSDILNPCVSDVATSSSKANKTCFLLHSSLHNEFEVNVTEDSEVADTFSDIFQSYISDLVATQEKGKTQQPPSHIVKGSEMSDTFSNTSYSCVGNIFRPIKETAKTYISFTFTKRS